MSKNNDMMNAGWTLELRSEEDDLQCRRTKKNNVGSVERGEEEGKLDGKTRVFKTWVLKSRTWLLQTRVPCGFYLHISCRHMQIEI